MLLKPLLDKTTIFTVDFYNWMPHYDHLVTAPCYPAEPPPVLCWPLTWPEGAVAAYWAMLQHSSLSLVLLYYCIIVLYCMDSTEFTAAGRCNPWHGQPGTGGSGQCGNLVSVPGPWSHGHNTAGHWATSLENGDTGSADLGTFSSCSYCSRQRNFASVRINATV